MQGVGSDEVDRARKDSSLSCSAGDAHSRYMYRTTGNSAA